jgi:hypothetical protein
VKPTVIVLDLARPPMFDATVNATEPLPLPPPPDVSVIHDEPAEEVQEQSLSVDTVIERLPPVCAKEPPLGLRV